MVNGGAVLGVTTILLLQKLVIIIFSTLFKCQHEFDPINKKKNKSWLINCNNTKHVATL